MSSSPKTSSSSIISSLPFPFHFLVDPFILPPPIYSFPVIPSSLKPLSIESPFLTPFSPVPSVVSTSSPSPPALSTPLPPEVSIVTPPHHSMTTRSQNNTLRPSQFRDGTMCWPPPRAHNATLTSNLDELNGVTKATCFLEWQRAMEAEF